MEDVYIIAASRTPIGSFNESFAGVSAHKLGATVIKKVLEQAKVSENEVDEVILGHVLTAGLGQNPARQASIEANIPQTIPAYGINMLCGSGLKAVAMGSQSIRLGDSQIVVAGGQENMSQAPHAINMRPGVKMGNAAMADTMVLDGLTDAFSNIHMGVTAENIAKKYGITREDQDQFSAESQQKAKRAQENGYFVKEIAPVTVVTRKEKITVSKDEYPKPSTTVETLARLRPAFDKNGTVTAGNASGINDGAAAVVLASGSKVKELNLTPMAKVVAWAQVGCDPQIMGIGPITAVQKALKSAGWTKDEVDLYELNEAFAAQSIAVVRELGLQKEKVNVNGGAIALGHPIGASGARVLVTLLYALQRTNGKKGVASLCIGGGMGIAMCVEMA